MKKIAWCMTLAFVFVFLCGFSEPDRNCDAVGEKNSILNALQELKLVIVPEGFKLTWKLSPQDTGKVTGYEICRSDRASGPFDSVATAGKGTAQYIDTTAQPEIIYFYKVRAIAEKGYSPFSNVVTGER